MFHIVKETFEWLCLAYATYNLPDDISTYVRKHKNYYEYKRNRRRARSREMTP